jgi:hypothetical protein
MKLTKLGHVWITHLFLLYFFIFEIVLGCFAKFEFYSSFILLLFCLRFSKSFEHNFKKYIFLVFAILNIIKNSKISDMHFVILGG